MESRVVFLAEEKEELKGQLEAYVAGKEQIEGCVRGVRKQDKDLPWLEDDDDSRVLIETWLGKGKLNKLAEVWCKGVSIDWRQLYREGKPHRMSVPTYPFAQERYWPKVRREERKHTGGASILHPLLHQNTSDLSEQRFSSTFTGQEFFLSDHVVRGKLVLPGVAYLEMVRAAVQKAAGVLDDGNTRIRLNHVVWVQPIVVDQQPVQIHIGLFPEDNGKIAYEIYSDTENGADPVVHGQGNADLISNADVPSWNLFDLQKQCNQSVLSPALFYEEARDRGIAFGSAFQSITQTYAGQGEVLTKLSLPVSVSGTQDTYVLHPSMMDAALQTATLCIMMGLSQQKLLLPFALAELEVIRGCTSAMWAYARHSHGNKEGGAVQKIDVDLCDDSGAVCVRIKGFSTRVLDGDVRPAEAASRSECLLLEPVWQEQAIVQREQRPSSIEHIVILCETATVVREHITTQMRDVRVLSLEVRSGTVAERYMTYAAQVFETIQEILSKKPQGNVLVQIVTSVASTHSEQQMFAGLVGLLKTAGLENAKLIGQLIEISSDEDMANVVELLQDNCFSPANRHIRYTNGKRYVADWQEVTVGQLEGESRPWKDKGVYLITGGAGALGLLFAREIAQQAKKATLILTGRSELSHEKQGQINEIRNLGAHVVYHQMDVTQERAVSDLIKHIVKEYGKLNGIIHSAGIIKDNYILKKTREELQEVMAPKVVGLENLDEASKDLELDFFLLFSSVSGGLGNAGQADYAMANTFMDAYAKYRNTLIAIKQRHGKTLSIDWSLWKEGGMHVDAETEKMLMQNMGMIPLQKEKGIKALYQAFATSKSQVFVMDGHFEKIKQKLLMSPMPRTQRRDDHRTQETKASIEVENLFDKVQEFLIKIASNILKVEYQDIDIDTELGEYGFDSISFTVFANQINQECQLELAPTIFFEYGNLRSLTEFLLEDHRPLLLEKFVMSPELAEPQIVTESITENEPLEPPIVKRRKSRFATRVIVSEETSKANDVEPIAIIGISGQFPGASNIDEFWENLIEGKDCITEIPSDRWDWQEYYGDPTKEANKTNIKWGGFIDGVAEFDPLFFGISPREAHFIDPQQRLLMTYAWKAIEDAGYSAQALSGTKTGVFIGTGNTGYKDLFYQANLPIEGHSTTGNMIPSVGPNRVSYLLNIHGPSEPIETACSSSLVAIHHAVSAMESGSCDMAIVGGVNTILTPEAHISYSKAGMLSKDGRCKTFSSQADGYVRGEGVGIIMLKKLKDAERDRDHIYGVIRGTAENHGGRANTLTSPNPKAQADLLVTAYKKANIDPRTVTYIDAHGTGTELGDPIEINGLKAAFKELHQATMDSDVMEHRCGLGSVKSNIGHLELAAGISGVIKVLLQLKHKTLVKSLHSEVLNPYIQLEDSPFYIVQENDAWRAIQDDKGHDLPRRAGVSSFGIGGVNAHVVIEEYIPKDEEIVTSPISSQNPAIIVLSAKNEKRLQDQVEQLLAAIRERKYTDTDLSRVAYTLQVGRGAMEERLALIVRTMVELEEKLQGFIAGKEGIEDLYRGQANRNKDTLAVFTVDEDMEKIFDIWISKRKYARLVDLWVKGLPIDWTKLYGEVRPRRISLPTYPFARDIYWLPEAEVSPPTPNGNGPRQSTAPAGAHAQAAERITHLLTKHWESSPVVPAERAGTTGTIAILTTAETALLATELSRLLPHAAMVEISRLEPVPVEADWTRFAGVIDLVGCGSTEDRSTGWISWLQRLVELGHKERLLLLGVSRGLESFRATSVNLAGAMRTGLYRMLHSEYPQLRSRHMDGEAHSPDAELAYQIAAEFFAESQEVEVCYRGGQRYRAYLAECAEGAGGEPLSPHAFAEEEVVLITGGTRGLGALCAQHLVRQYGVRRLVLTGREEWPPREQWEQITATATPLAEKIRAVQALEGQGVQVQVVSLRLSDEQAVQQCLREISTTMGPIAGVIHCAGLLDPTTLAFIRKTPSTIQDVLEPKVAGLVTLYEQMSHEPWHFFVLFSSVSGIVPVLSSGQSDYAMANAYMDYFAQAHQQEGRIVSIQWPNWKEAGMGEVTNRIYRETGLQSLTNEEGMHLLDQILGQQALAVVLPAVVEMPGWKPEELWRSCEAETMEIRRQARMQREQEERSVEAVVTPGVREATETWLQALFSEELRIDPSQLEMDEPVQEYGVDSIILAQIVQRINQKLMVTLDPSILYEYPTIAGFATWLSETYTTPLATMLAQRAPETTVDPVRTKVPSGRPVVMRPPMSTLTPQNVETHFLTPAVEDIAIIGLSCRFPGAETLDGYWELLAQGRSAIRAVPPERWGYVSSYAAGMLEDITAFDPAFFLLAEEDAQAMDPQALLVLEECLKLWYHAGYTPAEIKGKAIGIYLGARSQHRPDEVHLQRARNPIVAMGQNYLVANLSHYFDVRGPSMVVDTACSSALVSLNMAIQALRSQEIEAAVVGGVSVLQTDATHRLFQQRSLLCAQPAFHVFDERADGIVLGEGVGMVLVKTVKQALRDGDSIYAVIKATAVNNDGRTAGPATPSLQAQKEVMQMALARSGKRAEEISYLEANGSGSIVTDLIELKAIQAVYGGSRVHPLGVGSIKPNIGHPLCAEGIASLIKVVLMLQHRQMVPFLSGEQGLQHFDREAAQMSLSRTLEAWEEARAVAGINSFADGGTNAHVIVERWEEGAERIVRRRPLVPPPFQKRSLVSRDADQTAKKPDEAQALPTDNANIWDSYEVES